MNHRLAVRQSLHHGIAGVAVAILPRTLPDESGLLRRIVSVEQERARPAAVAVEIADEDQPVFFSPCHPGEAVLGLRQINRLPGKRGFEYLYDVARRDFLSSGAAVERLYPNQRGRLGRAPIVIARPRRHAFNR